MSELAERLREIRARIAAAAARGGRDAKDVRLVVVTKTHPSDVIAELVSAGVTEVGENRAQEFKEKYLLLPTGVRWHFVGHLQSNKVRDVVGRAALIHSIDRPGLAEAAARRAALLGVTQDVLLEVNVSGEHTKHGVEPAGVAHLARLVASLENLRLCGLMTMAPLGPPQDEARAVFAILAELGAALTAEFPSARELSMGMSGDFEAAVEEGASIVRIGEAILGPRRPVQR